MNFTLKVCVKIVFILGDIMGTGNEAVISVSKKKIKNKKTSKKKNANCQEHSISDEFESWNCPRFLGGPIFSKCARFVKLTCNPATFDIHIRCMSSFFPVFRFKRAQHQGGSVITFFKTLSDFYAINLKWNLCFLIIITKVAFERLNIKFWQFANDHYDWWEKKRMREVAWSSESEREREREKEKERHLFRGNYTARQFC